MDSSVVVICVSLAVAVRMLCALGSYSGQGTPPMFGDYEAQRHWMEITQNLPAEEWFVNSSRNDLMYWGIDYPPLTAYHSWICGHIAKWFNPAWVKLFQSRGYESNEHKTFMRYTVVIVDLFIYIPAVLSFCHYCLKLRGERDKGSGKQPTCPDVDNGGSSVVGSKGHEVAELLSHAPSCQDTDCHVTGCAKVKSVIQSCRQHKVKKDCPSCKQLVALYYIHAMQCRHLEADSVCEVPCCAEIRLRVRQQQRHKSMRQAVIAGVMLLYPGLILIDHGHFQYNCVSLGFALWGVVGLCTGHNLLGSIMFCLALNYKQMELYHAMPFFCYLLGSCWHTKTENRVFKLLKLAAVVIATFVACWAPFLREQEMVLHVLSRIFPVARGLFEDKVSNVWCALSIVIKLKQLPVETMVRISLIATCMGLLPSSANLLWKPSLHKFKYALVNSSLVFFLFSFQVHEKSILLAALPVMLILPEKPLAASWFLLISTFSMYPLLVKDGLLLQFFATVLLFGLAVFAVFFSEHADPHPQRAPLTTSRMQRLLTYDGVLLKIAFTLSCLEAVALAICSHLVEPPRHLPDLFPLLIAVYSCIHFLAFCGYFHLVQFSCLCMERATSETINKKKKK
ncbi:PREDICTED: dolichyl pyrophosphate Man9GlcNAc2 alpha-1,3-glucosyltransferase-like [Priapulus caudatus]|uniref:Alpha-1,3-glucosyltransferase n=1 Tax=Priapulus caudatus TaxID=37621 RepID=A0ABM1EMA7_PRICU|nr:PREDICTED: dolichyl pyrophosphate Man9GlcNAc2 alpha-1,3-glucosyltransferase-like [Priapulus caudatus]XP_014673328.1 PREDICTED: dolichyl pyrophosphate Man9GlcNAc2 alpha-1,3-glucosyltransferase-like [Priapulus caudatus]